MQRQREGQESLVYAYGAVIPLDRQVLGEVDKQKRMWNRLVDADREYGRCLLAAMMQDPEYAAARTALDTAWAKVNELRELRNKARGQARSARKTPHDDALQAAWRQKNDARAVLWRARSQWMRTHKDEVRRLDRGRYAQNKKIRQESGLYWGNYNRVIDAFEAARKMCLKKHRHARYKEDSPNGGVLTVQVQKTQGETGMSPGYMHSGKYAQFSVVPVPNSAHTLGARQRSRAVLTQAAIRCDAAGHRLRFAIWLHRPLPDGMRIKSVQLVWDDREHAPRKIAEQVTTEDTVRVVRGRLCLTLSGPAEVREHDSAKACGVDLGWRLLDDGALLVATLLDSDGESKRYSLPVKWMRGMDQVERLRSYVDTGLEEVAAWIKDHGDTVDPRLAAAVADWNPRRSAGHIDRDALHDAVREIGFRNVPEPVLDWYRRYRHLKLWQDNLRGKLLRNRRERFRLAAKEIASRYARIGLEDMDLSRMARTKKREDGSDNELHAAARAQRVRACVHELRAEIVRQAAKYGAELVYRTKNTTQRCTECGGITQQGDRAKRVWVCEHCGAAWDQDLNAAQNLLLAATGDLPDAPGGTNERLREAG